jgi:hypothetical protein
LFLGAFQSRPLHILFQFRRRRYDRIPHTWSKTDIKFLTAAAWSPSWLRSYYAHIRTLDEPYQRKTRSPTTPPPHLLPQQQPRVHVLEPCKTRGRHIRHSLSDSYGTCHFFYTHTRYRAHTHTRSLSLSLSQYTRAHTQAKKMGQKHGNREMLQEENCDVWETAKKESCNREVR